MLKNLVFPVLATLAAAASLNSCSFSTTISAASAVQNLNSCPTLSGDITVTGDQLASVDLSQVNAIDADLLFFNSSSITDINFGGLANVTGLLGFSALTQMHNIEFSALTAAKELLFVSLPSLAALNLGLGLATVSQLTLSDTALSLIDLLLNFETIGVLNVNNNKNVTLIDLSSLQNVTEGLTLSFNSDNATVKLDKLQWASNLTLQDIGDVSIGSLQYVNGSFVVAYNSFDSVSFDSLSNVGASLQIFANDNLESLNLANLTEIDGEFHVFNNTYLEEIELDSLQTVKGAVSMKGDFGNFTLPDLKEVDGDFSIESTLDDFSCEAFDKLHKNNKIKGHNYNCLSPSTTQSSSAASSTSKSSSKSSGASSTSGLSLSSTSTSSTKSSSAAAFSPATFLGCVVAAAAALLI